MHSFFFFRKLLLMVILGGIFVRDVACSKRTKLLVVSFDGFRWDYPQLFHTPNFDDLKRNGVYASRGVKPVFVSNTFPNHFSMATGLFAEDHGILDNNMYNATSRATFSVATTDPTWWQGPGEPIWLTAKRQGLRTGVFFWVGSAIPIRNQTPDLFVDYNKTISYEERLETVVNWLDKDLVDLAMLYFEEPDSTGHGAGIASPEFQRVVEGVVDSTLGKLMTKLDRLNLLENLNVLVVSDHGMTNLTQDIITLKKTFPGKEIDRVVPGTGPTVGIFPRNDVAVEELYKRLQHAHPNMTVYKKQDIPDHLRYRKHGLIAPILAIADEGFVISHTRNKSNLIGYHGYRNDLISMRSIFLARGPAFKKHNFAVDSFQTVDLYPLMCQLLAIEPAPNNGSLQATRAFFTSKAANALRSETSIVPLFLCCSTIFTILHHS